MLIFSMEFMVYISLLTDCYIYGFIYNSALTADIAKIFSSISRLIDVVFFLMLCGSNSDFLARGTAVSTSPTLVLTVFTL